MDVVIEPTVALDAPLADWLTRVAARVLEGLDAGEDAEACLVLTDDDGIHELNRTWRGIDRPTDVLSFPQQEGDGAFHTPGLLGDIVVSVPTARRVAAAGAHRDRVASDAAWDGPWSLGHELAFLVVHGALHLVGHDHAEPEEEARMRAEEGRIFRDTLTACGPPPNGPDEDGTRTGSDDVTTP